MTTSQAVTLYYTDILSLSTNQSESDYVISGINTQEIPLQITWNVTADALVNPIDVLIPNTATQCTPYLICGYTSCLEIAGSRQITLIN